MVTEHYEIVVPSQVCEECVVRKKRRLSFLIVSHGHIPKENRKKLDDRDDKCVFLGLSETWCASI